VLKSSLLLFLLLGVALLGTGLVYLTRSEFMPYHARAIQTDWSALTPHYQGLLLGMLKGLAAGQISAGGATVLMSALSLRGSARPYAVLLPVVCLGYSILITHATYVVSARTPGEPPLAFGVTAILLAFAASVMLQLGVRREHGARAGADGGSMSPDPSKHVLLAGEGEVIEMHGPTAGSIEILVDPTNTGETDLCTLIQTLDPGAAVPIHRHEKAEQVLHFLSGRGTVSLSGHEVEVEPGTTVHVPKGVEHGIANAGAAPLSFLEVTTPPGFQQAFRSMSRLTEPTAQAIARVAGQHDILISEG